MHRSPIASRLRLRMRPERAWAVIGSARTWIILVLLVHVAGRIGAVCAPSKFDSFVYAIAAYKFYDPAATGDDLVPDKPGGQALLTGWSYRILPGPPTRLTLIPIESAFLLAGYLLFGVTAARLFGRDLGPFLCFLLALGINTYNTLDSSVAGLNVNENYLLLPMIAAAAAHLRIRRPWLRGLLAGLAVGTALTVKQTAAGLLAVLLVCELSSVLCRGRRLDGLKSTAGLLIGCLVAWVPLATYLYARGWWWPHLDRLLGLSGRHMAWMPLSLPSAYKLVPLAPEAWWTAVGLAAAAGLCLSRRYSPIPPSCKPRPTEPPKGHIVVFAVLWMMVELAILWAMTKRSAHYYQQIVPPAVLLAGIGLTELRRAQAVMGLSTRKQACRWLLTAGATLVLLAGMPLAAETSRRARTFDFQREIRDFQFWLAHWSPQSLTDDGWRIDEDRCFRPRPTSGVAHIARYSMSRPQSKSLTGFPFIAKDRGGCAERMSRKALSRVL